MFYREVKFQFLKQPLSLHWWKKLVEDMLSVGVEIVEHYMDAATSE